MSQGGGGEKEMKHTLAFHAEGKKHKCNPKGRSVNSLSVVPPTQKMMF